MNFYQWMALAFLAGTLSVIVYYKRANRVAAVCVLASPFCLAAIFGWPTDNDFREVELLSVALWGVASFLGGALATAAVVLGIVRG